MTKVNSFKITSEQSLYLKNLSLIIISILFCTHCSYAGIVDAKHNRLDDKTAQYRIENLEPQVVLPYTNETKRLLDIYTYSYLPGARKIVARSNNYFARYDYILSKKGLPVVLKNIAVVESNMDPWTFSSRGAVGVWQLMKSTAKAHGLIIDRYVDERFDPMRASEVAFDYLKQLYREFGDWNLALIAYNFGPSALRKTMRYCGSQEYNEIKEALPKEFKKYASRLAAAAYLSKYFSEHNNRPSGFDVDAKLASIPVYTYITFDEIATITGLKRQEIIEYNPAITYDYLPTNSKGYTINLPLKQLALLITTREWDMNHIAHLDYHREDLERLLPFYSSPINSKHDSTDKSEEENQKSSISSYLALRREQILKMLSLG